MKHSLPLALLLTLWSPFPAHGDSAQDCGKDYPKVSEQADHLYKGRHYQEAFNELEKYLDSCEGVRPEDRYWIWSHQAMYAYRLKKADDCLATLDKADKFRQGHGAGSPEVQKSLQYNRNLCERLKHQGS